MLWFALHVLFDSLRPVAVPGVVAELPLLASWNGAALGLTLFAAYLMLRLKLEFPVVLAFCATAAGVITLI